MDRTTTRPRVAEIIREQIGVAALAMLGIKALVAEEHALTLHVSRGPLGVTHVRVELDASADLYIVRAYRWVRRTLELREVAVIRDVFCGDLAAVIGGLTGLAVSLGGAA